MKPKIVVSLVGFLIVGLVVASLQCSSVPPPGGGSSFKDSSSNDKVSEFVDPNSPVVGGSSAFQRFSSYDELNEFVKKNMDSSGYLPGGERMWLAPGNVILGVAEAADSAYGGGLADYSGTNIQVEGVDEADIVKTDGEFIYLVSGETVVIVKAYPPEEVQVLSRIELDKPPTGLFINGDRLIVLHQSWDLIEVPMTVPSQEGDIRADMPISRTSINVYDVSDREAPIFKRDITLDGESRGTRMVGDYVYAVIGTPALSYDGEVRMPEIRMNGVTKEIAAAQVYYCNVTDYHYSFTQIVAVNTQDDSQEPAYETLLVGSSSTIYVSLNNIYITSPRWWVDGKPSETTLIHRIEIKGGTIESKASGEVPGSLLNQFSMDEYQGFFRVATTLGHVARFFDDVTSLNNVYVLDMDLDIVGNLEDLAPGETIYSARFMGERCYLVTFKKVDPFFVIDLADPYNPKVLGELKITGYSDYLHPYDENHVIGIGKETIEAQQGDFAWYQGVKISLFDVSDVANPREIAKYEIGDRGTDSPVLRDHKALLFDASRNLLVIPVLVAEVEEGGLFPGIAPRAYGRPVWQGAYVFKISPDEGLNLRGRITHYDNDSWWAGKDYYFSSSYSIERSMYIGDVLYTISEKKVMMNDLESLDYVNEVEIGD